MSREPILTKAMQRINQLKRDRRGNMAMTFGLIAVPLMLAVGASLDYVRAYNVQRKIQVDLDAGLLAAVKHIDDQDAEKLKATVEDWFAAQTNIGDTVYAVTDVKISKNSSTISAAATATIPTTFMRVANIQEMTVNATSTVTGPATAFLEVDIVLDKSASMLLAANTSDQATLRADSAISCEFACHDTADPVYKNGRKVANTYYDYMKNAYGAELRADVAVKAAKEVVDLIEEANSSTDHIRVGLYTLGATTTEVLAPSSSFPKIKRYLEDDSYGLTSKTSEGVSYFDKSLSELKSLVGKAGDGSSRSRPLKLVLLLTDGVQSSRPWVINGVNWNWGDWDHDGVSTPKSGTYWNYVAPMNPSWCKGMKDSGVTVGVLYTEYLEIEPDWGYQVTLDDKMANTRWKSIWGGEIRNNVSSSTKKRDYIPYALEDCATSGDLFLSASDPDKIKSGLSEIFNQYLSKVRLTQ